VSRIALSLALSACSVLSCSLLFSISDEAASGSGEGGIDDVTTEGGVSSSASDAEPGDGAAPLLHCAQTGRGPNLVPAGDRLCIDGTLVTRAQYDTFLAAAVSLDSQIDGCSQNKSFVPFTAAEGGDYPVDGVDWCDAFTYCSWAGKRLCGASPGTDAGALPDAAADAGFAHGIAFTEVQDRSIDEWMYACQGGDHALVYPYGNDLNPDACYSTGGGFQPAEMGPVGSRPCEGGFPGLFDMVGNVQEWIDSCRDDSCTLVGASTCRDWTLATHQLQQIVYEYEKPIGFRCCGVAPPAP
jgi:hypothetical protein